MVSSDAYTHFKTFVSHHKKYEKLLIEMDFQRSTLYHFYDKHHYPKTGYLVWCRKPAVVIPPSISSKDFS